MNDKLPLRSIYCFGCRKTFAARKIPGRCPNCKYPQDFMEFRDSDKEDEKKVEKVLENT